MQALDGLLFRRGESRRGFDFPAYRELLFLYSIARELAGQVETDFGTIDLFLPLEDAPPSASARDDGTFAGRPRRLGLARRRGRPKSLVIRRRAGRRGAPS